MRMQLPYLCLSLKTINISDLYTIATGLDNLCTYTLHSASVFLGYAYMHFGAVSSCYFQYKTVDCLNNNFNDDGVMP